MDGGGRCQYSRQIRNPDRDQEHSLEEDVDICRGDGGGADSEVHVHRPKRKEHSVLEELNNSVWPKHDV